MDADLLIELYPQLFHMASAGSWPSIRANGLLTTKEIVSTAGLPPAEVERILSERRPASITLEHPLLGSTTIRDQMPLRLQFLEPKLVDQTVTEWVETLNDRVFFWLLPVKLEGLLTATQYKKHEQDVLTVDTRSLVRAYGNRIQLSPINSGAALYPNAAFRGRSTFSAISDYDYVARRRARGATDAIVELAVVGGVPDVRDHVVNVQRWRGSQLLGDLPLD